MSSILARALRIRSLLAALAIHTAQNADWEIHADSLAITDPELIPAARYYDEGFFDLEVEKVWPHARWPMGLPLGNPIGTASWPSGRTLCTGFWRA